MDYNKFMVEFNQPRTASCENNWQRDIACEFGLYEDWSKFSNLQESGEFLQDWAFNNLI